MPKRPKRLGTLEDISRSSSSGPDSALQKRQKTVEGLKHACEQATKNGDTTSRDFQDARVLAGKDNKNANELETRAAGLLKRTYELEAQVQEIDASIGWKDGSMTKMHEEKQELVKDIRTMTAEREGALKNETDTKAKEEKLVGQLKAQDAGVSHLRNIAEPRASKQEALANEAVKPQKVAEERATQQETRAAKVEEISEAARAKDSRAEANATEVAEQLRSKDKRIATLKADAESSYRYLQRSVDTAEATNADLPASLTRAKTDANEAEARARVAQEVLEQRIVELEKVHREKPTCADASAPKNGSSAQEELLLPKSQPVVHSTSSNVGPKAPWRSGNRPLPRCKPPANLRTIRIEEEGTGLRLMLIRLCV